VADANTWNERQAGTGFFSAPRRMIFLRAHHAAIPAGGLVLCPTLHRQIVAALRPHGAFLLESHTPA